MKPEKVDRVRKKNKIVKTEINEELTEDKQQRDSCTSLETDNLLNLCDTRTNSKSPHDSSSYVDISALAEECIFEEVKIVDEREYFEKPLPMITHKSNEAFNLSYEEEKESDKSELHENYFPSTLYKSNPTFHFTFEEDFKIYELMVRKENLVDGIFQTFMEHPDFTKLVQQFLLSINSGTDYVYKGACYQFILSMRNYIISNFMNGGVIRQSLDMFDYYKHVDESVKPETFFFSMSVFHLCIR